MNCPVCGAPLEEGAKFCTDCGARIDGELVIETAPPEVPAAPAAPAAPAEPRSPSRPAAPPPPAEEPVLPKQYRPIKGWGYFGLELLFAVPIIGLIFLLIFTFHKGNINRRNFARSYWCALLVWAVVLLVLAVVGYATGFAQDFIEEFEYLYASLM